MKDSLKSKIRMIELFYTVSDANVDCDDNVDGNGVDESMVDEWGDGAWIESQEDGFWDLIETQLMSELMS